MKARGTRLARVSGEDVALNEHQREGYQQYIRDHPEEAQRFGIMQLTRLAEGELVVVVVDARNQTAIYPLLEIAADLPGIKMAGGELTEASAPAVKEYLRLGDLARRWHYSRKGVQKRR